MVNTIWTFFAGLGIFLFGMSLLERAIKSLSGESFKKLIRIYTKTHLRSVASGFITTGILQSSSAVSLMVLAFVGAGIMTLENAIGVILGSNIGTTMTSWIVATLGFKIKLEALAMPLIGIGGIAYAFSTEKTIYRYLSELALGFGLLFMGIGMMKTSVDGVADNFDLKYISGYGILAYLLFGLALTALIQSSSAAVAIVLTALNSGIIDFSIASAIVIGANIGTTATVLLGSIGGASEQRKVAYSHFLFNLISGIVALLTLPVLVYILNAIPLLANDPVVKLASFHTLFNLLGVGLFFPFIKPFAGLVQKLTHTSKEQKQEDSDRLLKIIDTKIPEAAIHQWTKEIKKLVELTACHNLQVFQLNHHNLPYQPTAIELISQAKSRKERYQQIQLLQAELFTYSAYIQQDELTENQRERMERLLHCIRNSVFSAKNLKDAEKDLHAIQNSKQNYLQQCYREFEKKIIGHYSALFTLLHQDITSKEMLAQINQLIAAINRDDDRVIELTIHEIEKSQLDRKTTSYLLIFNRSFSMSTRQLLFAIKDFLLEEADSRAFDQKSH